MDDRLPILINPTKYPQRILSIYLLMDLMELEAEVVEEEVRKRVESLLIDQLDVTAPEGVTLDRK